ncbi:MAG: Crp/Fnr family transcriptional regulator [bacterium]|nr:Crp/Fnr family transcriptional regulator [bacterium]
MLRTETFERPFSRTWETGFLSRNAKGRAIDRPEESMPPALSRNSVLNGLPAPTLKKLWPNLRRIHVEREQFIFQQDDDLEFLYFPETAVLSELHMLDDGRMVEVAITGCHGAIGLGSLYEASQTSNCVQATQAGSLLRIESCLLRKHCRNDSQLPLLLHSSLASYIRQISLRSVCNMYHSVEERLCTWLLLIRDLGGQTRLKLTHEQIARALGVYRPSVTSIALELRKRQLIDYSRGGISITDRAGLEAAACDCYYELTSDAASAVELAQAV